jgi:hypothetical protein
MRGIAQGVPTKQLADELGRDYGTLLERRHRIQRLAFQNRPTEPLPDKHTEADEMFQNAGEKGREHNDPDDPPRNSTRNFYMHPLQVHVKYLVKMRILQYNNSGCM